MARILIVEDELLIIEDIRIKLQRLGHTVVAYATTGEAAVQKTVMTKPELVFMDVRLRGKMNGIEAARRIREVHAVPVVYVTAHAQLIANEIDPSQRQFVLTKPFSVSQLESVLHSAL
jgi:CheY-like chemotaxis protein